MPAEYLGDAVYVDVKNGMLELTTQGGFDNQKIYLEVEVYQKLRGYVRKNWPNVELEITKQQGPP